ICGIGIDRDLSAYSGGKGEPSALACHARSGKKEGTNFFALKNFLQNARSFPVGNHHHSTGVHGDFSSIKLGGHATASCSGSTLGRFTNGGGDFSHHGDNRGVGQGLTWTIEQAIYVGE